jgi:type IV fimbrial biogenesis protein FimT
MTKKSGFTIVELMIAIAILSILSAIAVPSFSSLIKSSGISSGSNSIYADILFIRAEALKSHNSVYLCASNNGSSCNGTTTDGEEDWSNGYIAFTRQASTSTWPDINNGDTLLLATDYSNELMVKSNKGQIMYMDANGTTDNMNFVVCSTDGDESIGKTITLSNSGRPHINHSVTGSCGV